MNKFTSLKVKTDEKIEEKKTTWLPMKTGSLPLNMNENNTVDIEKDEIFVIRDSSSVIPACSVKKSKKINEYYEGSEMKSSGIKYSDDNKINKKEFAWVRRGNSMFISAKPNTEELPAGLYEIKQSMESGIFLERRSVILDDLFLPPSDVMGKIVNDIKKFWTSREKYADYGIIYKRGILTFGKPGCGKCHTKGTKIMMYDGAIKNVEDIKKGDLLMGDDSTPRKVLSLATGQEECYNVIPNKYGDVFGVNESHILVLYISPSKKGAGGKVIEMTVADYKKQNASFKHHAKLLRTKVSFKPTNDPELNPYFLGLWLGDGLWSDATIFVENHDTEIQEFLSSYAESLGMVVTVTPDAKSDKLSKWCLVKNPASKKSVKSPLQLLMDGLLVKNKILPTQFLTASEEYRKQIIAGYMDSDGHKRNADGCYEVTSKRYESLLQIRYICRSLGYNTTIAEKIITPTGKSNVAKSDARLGKSGKTYKYHRLNITNAYDIPCLLERKKSTTNTRINKNGNVEQFTLEPLGMQQYYGFEINGNHRYLLGDTTITHNTSLFNLLMGVIIDEYNGIVINMDNINTFISMAQNIRALEPDRPILCIIEDLDGFLQYNSVQAFLNLLDGNAACDNIVYLGSTNYIKRLEPRVLRSSRFDRKYEIAPPNDTTREFYFKKKLKDEDIAKLGAGGLARWVQDTKGMAFSDMKEIIASVIVMEMPYDEVLEELKKYEESYYQER